MLIRAGDRQHCCPCCRDPAWPRNLWVSPGCLSLPVWGQQQAQHQTHPLFPPNPPISNITAHTTPNAQEQEQGSSPEWGRAAPDPPGCEKCQPQLKWQKNCQSPSWRGWQNRDGSRWRGHCPLQLCVTAASACSARELPQWRKKSQKNLPSPQLKADRWALSYHTNPSKPQIKSEHWAPTPALPGRDLSPLQTQTTTWPPKWSPNLHLGHPPSPEHLPRGEVDVRGLILALSCPWSLSSSVNWPLPRSAGAGHGAEWQCPPVQLPCVRWAGPLQITSNFTHLLAVSICQAHSPENNEKKLSLLLHNR